MAMKIPVIFGHSAAIDDFVATAVLSTMPDIEIKGIFVINADCIAVPAMDTSSRVHQFLGLDKKNVPLTLSAARGWNAFPWEYRADCIKMGSISSLDPFSSQLDSPYDSGERMIEELLRKAIAEDAPSVLLVTGPITAVTDVLRDDPDLASGIKDVVWMGGAIDVRGNLDPNTLPKEIANDKAEWNAFWDPASIDEMFEIFSGVNIFPLDITDQARITSEFKRRLREQGRAHRFSRFVSEAYALVEGQPYYEMWNTLATCYLGSAASSIFDAPEQMPLTIELWGNDTQGWIHREVGRNVQSVYLNMKDKSSFYEYVLERLRTDVASFQ